MIKQQLVATSLRSLFTLWTMIMPFLAVSAWGSNRLSENFTYGQLKETITRQSIQNVDQLLMILPQSTLQNYAMVFNSRSVQPATPENPRVLLFRNDGGMGMAFSTIVPNALEILEFNSVTNKIEPRMIKFGVDVEFIDDPLKRFANSPMKCTRCHSERVHYIWDSYPRWPGIFGHTDKAKEHEVRLEALQLNRLKSKIDEKNLLRHLPGIQEATVKKLGDRNANTSMLIGRTNAKRIMQLITESPQFMEYRAVLFAALIGDVNFEYYLKPEDQKEFHERRYRIKDKIIELQTAYAQELNVRQKQAGAMPSEKELEQAGYLPKYDHVAATKFLFLAEKMGLSTQDWWMTLEKETFSGQDGNIGLWKELINSYSEVLRSTDPEIVKNEQLIPYKATFKYNLWDPITQKIQNKIWSQMQMNVIFPKWYSPKRILRTCKDLVIGDEQ